MTRGVCYLLAGTKFSERIVVSTYTLRQHWDGPIRIFCLDDDSTRMAQKLETDPNIRASVERIDKAPVKRHGCYCTKPLLTSLTPWKRSVFIDADTTIHGPIDGLFEHDGMAITTFAKWHSQGKIIGGRCQQWRKLKAPAVDRLVAAQKARPWPAINTGVFGWEKGYHGLPLWSHLTTTGWNCSFTDEVAMQLLYPLWADCTLLPDRWNCSPFFGIHKNDATIYHYHGSKHVRKPQGKAIWWPEYEKARAANVAGLREWGGQFDKTIPGE